ncbi:Potential ribosomal protein [Lachnospiraceae bacterium KM106-2]|nr:Potential ribosomal protein [Lachnospiraceae bacterium KM106-2]
MIKISIKKNANGAYRGFRVFGHAGFDDYGRDIVCASVSVLVINTINSIEHFTKDSFDLVSDEDQGLIELNFKNNLISDKTTLLLDSLVLGLQGIEENYENEYIKLILEEV